MELFQSTVAYGLWPLVILNSVLMIFFAFSFFRPKSRRDWRTFGSFSAFIIALFVEMYGFPLTIYLLSGWLSRLMPGLDPLTHNAGHLWETVLGVKGNPHLSPLHLLSDLLIVGSFVLLAAAWKVLYTAQKSGRLATTGPYRFIRHPQYIAFLVIMVGYLVQWPTIITALMFPILLVAYVRTAHREEREMLKEFAEIWTDYAKSVPRWLPRFGVRHGHTTAEQPH